MSIALKIYPNAKGDLHTFKTEMLATDYDFFSNTQENPNSWLVTWSSRSSNLVAGDTNNTSDIFFSKWTNGDVTRQSTDKNGNQADAYGPFELGSYGPVFDPIQPWKILFESGSPNLVPNDTAGKTDIFIKNTVTGEIVRVSTASDGSEAFGGSFGSEKAKFSPDGKKIAFYSDATNLVASDTNGTLDLFVKNLETGLVQRVSTKSNGEQISDPFPGQSLYDPVFSPDGSKIAFVTKSPNFVANDTSGQYDVFLKDLNTGAVTRVSTTSDGSEAIGGGSFNPVFSPNGKLLAFASEATNFAQSDKNGKLDVFIKTIEDGGDYQGGVGSLRRVSVDFNGKEGLGDSGQSISFSPDSKTIAFSSLVSTFVSGDTNEASDIFIKDIATNNSSGAIVRVSTDKGGVQLKSGSYDVKFVSDHYVSFKNGDNVYLKHLNNYDANDTGINKVTIPVDGSSGATTTEYIGTNQVVQVLSLDGLKSDYSIAYADLSLSPSLSAIPLNITDQVASRNGAFKTTYVERLNFDDVSTAFDLSGKAGQLHALYDALLNRTGDEVGLGFWLSQLDSGKPLSEVAQAFLASPEYKAAGSKTNADFVDMLYSHGLERPADAAGKAYWVDLLNNGKATLADVAVSFASSAEQMAQTIPEVGAKGLDYQVWAM